MLKKRYSGLDILKSIAAFLVVCIHIPFPGEIGAYFVSLTRIAVPIFFMISGFFFDITVQKGKTVQQIKKIIKLVLVANALFFLWKIVYIPLSGEDLMIWFKELFTKKNALEFFFFNVSHINGHLWYLNAILYTLVIVEILRYKNLIRLLYPMIPILLGVDLLFGKYSMVIWGREFDYVYLRNYIFVGLPYFLVGMLLFEFKEKLLKKLSCKKLLFFIVVFIFTTLLERFFLVTKSLNATRDHYLSTTFLAVALFLFFVKFYEERELTNIEVIMEKIGYEKSTYIYIVHPIIITVLNVIARKLNIYDVYRLIAPIIVYMCSIVVATMFIHLLKYKKTKCLEV